MNMNKSLSQTIIKLLPDSNSYTTKNGYITLTRTKNSKLFELLDQTPLWKFLTTNKGNLIGYHQIVNFLDEGIHWFDNGIQISKTSHEVHHLNGNTKDNNPDNLKLVSREDHKIISQASHTKFFGTPLSPNPTGFNKQGKPVVNHRLFLANLISKTVCLITKVSVDAHAILLNLPAEIYKKITNWNSDCISKTIRKTWDNLKTIDKNLFISHTAKRIQL